MKLLILSILLLIFYFIKQKLFPTIEIKKVRSYKEFWEWFRNNERVLEIFIKKGKYDTFFYVITQTLEPLIPQTSIEIGINDKKISLIFSADGKIKYFPLVKKLVEEAPNLGRWEFFALKPPLAKQELKNIKLEIRRGNNEYITYRIDDIYFKLKYNPEKPLRNDLVFFFKNFNSDYAIQYYNSLFIFLDKCLGEETLETEINEIEIEKLVDTKDLKPLIEIQDFINKRKQEYKEYTKSLMYDKSEANFLLFDIIDENQFKTKSQIYIDIGLLNSKSLVAYQWLFSITTAAASQDNSSIKEPSPLEKEAISLIEKETEIHIVAIKLDIDKRTLFFVSRDYHFPLLALHFLSRKSQTPFEFDVHLDRYLTYFDKFKNS